MRFFKILERFLTPPDMDFGKCGERNGHHLEHLRTQTLFLQVVRCVGREPEPRAAAQPSRTRSKTVRFMARPKRSPSIPSCKKCAAMPGRRLRRQYAIAPNRQPYTQIITMYLGP